MHTFLLLLLLLYIKTSKNSTCKFIEQLLTSGSDVIKNPSIYKERCLILKDFPRRYNKKNNNDDIESPKILKVIDVYSNVADMCGVYNER